MSKKVNIGVDVSKNTLDFSLRVGTSITNTQIPNNKELIQVYISQLLKKYPTRTLLFCFETTNTYHNNLKSSLISQQLLYKEVNPYKFTHYLKHLNSTNKSDILDSDGLSLFCSTLKEDDFLTSDKKYSKSLKSYTTTISLLAKIQTQLKNLLNSQEQLENKELDTLIFSLIKEVNRLKNKIRDLAYELCTNLIPQTKDIVKNIKGVGKDLAITLFPILADNTDKNVKQISSYLGLSPRTYQSGTSVYKQSSITKRGNTSVRKSLFLSALVSIRYNDTIKEKYQSFLQRGKPKKIALVAIMNMLVRWIKSYFNKNEILCNVC